MALGKASQKSRWEKTIKSISTKTVNSVYSLEYSGWPSIPWVGLGTVFPGRASRVYFLFAAIQYTQMGCRQPGNVSLCVLLCTGARPHWRAHMVHRPDFQHPCPREWPSFDHVCLERASEVGESVLKADCPLPSKLWEADGEVELSPVRCDLDYLLLFKYLL